MSVPTHQKGALPHSKGCRFVVWAPHADEVFVVGSFNNWDARAHPLTKDQEGTWSADVLGAKPGNEYRYRIVAGGREYSRIDPYAYRVTSSKGNSVVPQLFSPVESTQITSPPLNEMVIYELHIGTFGKKTVEPGPGNLEGAIERLEHLKELGVNAIEVMPVGEFPGGFSWGYNPSLIFAVESDYCTPRTFREFVIESTPTRDRGHRRRGLQPLRTWGSRPVAVRRMERERQGGDLLL